MSYKKAKHGNLYASTGATTFQTTAFKKHERSSDHKAAEVEWNLKEKGMKPLVSSLENQLGAHEQKVVVGMKVLHFISSRNIALSNYQPLMELLFELNTPNAPNPEVYGSYTNETSGKEMLFVMRDVARHVIKRQIQAAPFISICVDESIDIVKEKHLIVYVVLPKSGGEIKTTFYKILELESGTSACLMEAISELFKEWEVDWSKLVGFASDGASVMVGHKTGLVARLKAKVPRLVSIHCMAHRQALATQSAARSIPEFQWIDKLAAKVYKYVTHSCVHMQEFKGLFDEYQLENVKVLKPYEVRWLSKGEVMKRLVILLPIIWGLWEEKEQKWFRLSTRYQVGFFVALLADVCGQLNILSKCFQKENLSMIEVGRDLDLTINMLKNWFLTGTDADFGFGCTQVALYMDKVQNGFYEHYDQGNGILVHSFPLSYEPVEGSCPENDGSHKACVQIGRAFVQSVVDNLNERYMDMAWWNATKMFEPKSHDKGLTPRQKFNKFSAALMKLVDVFCVGASPVASREGCMNQLQMFMEALSSACPTCSIHEAWQFCNSVKEEDGNIWYERYPDMMKLWQVVMLMPVSSAACERGFSKQNILKTALRNQMCLNTLDAHMLLGIEYPLRKDINWGDVFETWSSTRHRRG